MVHGNPVDQSFLEGALPGHDAVVLLLGIDHRGPITLFSDSTGALVRAKEGAGEGRGRSLDRLGR